MFGFNKQQMIGLINSYWPKSHKSKRNLEKIKEDCNIIRSVEKEENYINDQSFDDLSMEEVFKTVDRTNSSPGEAMLMYTLTNPIFDIKELEKRDKIVDEIKENKNLRDKLNYLFFDLGREGKREVLSFILDDKKGSKLKRLVYMIIGSLIPLCILGAIWIDLRFIFLALVVYLVNIEIHYHRENKYELWNIPYLAKLISTLKKVKEIDDYEFREFRDKACDIYERIKPINKEMFYISKSEEVDSLLDLIFLFFLLQERGYYKFIEILPKYREDLYEAYKLIGEIDTYCSIAALREDLRYYSKPEFNKKKEIKIEEGYHILLENPIANSIEVNKTGAIITGSNMSGKSTFLKMVSLNCLFAQTLYTCTSKRYEGDLFHIITSLNPKEDILEGRSYYLGEAKAILNILQEQEKGKNVVCFIDEIFRGTNPLERISASRALLNYFHKAKVLCLISTHDIEITRSFDDKYNFYHFEDDVSKEKGLIFDYHIKRGIGTKSNAIKLLEYIGYPEEITKEANETIEELRKLI
ncbi:MutS-related protein [Clostridium sp. 'White wine YQ']|uniref:MutS-related protein n=1 Tax=Clostridium sp. 'White wine YQ' TaxID=3027474 RepID=UPI002366A822|nr:hypothetical protein [Clostridium sp. 'White wine YQ']MDD7795228.1 hypothetical protein [Clostridium sp. 'White wine YQ']